MPMVMPLPAITTQGSDITHVIVAQHFAHLSSAAKSEKIYFIHDKPGLIDFSGHFYLKFPPTALTGLSAPVFVCLAYFFS
jgi:hypothetical protein